MQVHTSCIDPMGNEFGGKICKYTNMNRDNTIDRISHCKPSFESPFRPIKKRHVAIASPAKQTLLVGNF